MSIWKALREKYRRKRNKTLKTKCGMAAVYHRKWSLYDTVSFLEPDVRKLPTVQRMQIKCKVIKCKEGGDFVDFFLFDK